MNKPIIRIKDVVMVPISKLVPFPKNPNSHSPEQIKRLADIIEFQGFRYPIKVSNRSGFVTSGHGRIEAAKLKGWEEVPVSYQDYDSEAQEYADVVSDNAIAEWSDLDLSAIKTEIKSLKSIDIDLLGLKDLDVEFVKDKSEPGCDEDEVPEIDEKEEPKTKLGDIYKLGDHRLMCGDSTDLATVEKLMGGEKADMVFTDPPYGVNAVGGSKAFGTVGGPEKHKNKIIKANVYSKIIGDDTTDTAVDSFAVAQQISKNQIFWGAQCYAEKLPPSQGWIVWDKDTTGNLGDGELAWTNQDRAIRIFKHTWNGLIKESERREKRCHPTQKPIALAEWCFENYGRDDKIILDLFGGSGSTLIACEKTNRKCFMLELDEHYCDVIVARWEKYTGRKAELISSESNADKSQESLP